MNQTIKRNSFWSAVNGAAMLLIWLVLAGISTQEPTINEWLSITLLPALFFVVHVYFKYPRTLETSRLNLSFDKHLFYFGVPISLFLVCGDILWLIARNQLDLEAEINTIPFMLSLIILFPLIEEFGFRLWIQTPLERRLGPITAILLTALVFSVVHSAEFPLPQFIAGVGFGVALVVTGSIWAAVAMHAFSNAIIVILERIPSMTDWAISQASKDADWVPYLAGAFWFMGMCLIILWYVLKRPIKTNQ